MGYTATKNVTLLMKRKGNQWKIRKSNLTNQLSAWKYSFCNAGKFYSNCKSDQIEQSYRIWESLLFKLGKFDIYFLISFYFAFIKCNYSSCNWTHESESHSIKISWFLLIIFFVRFALIVCRLHNSRLRMSGLINQMHQTLLNYSQRI